MTGHEVFLILQKVRERKPLVHHITNWVTIYDCANIVKVFGASPVMAHAKEESGDMAGLASALVLNIGTLTPELVESMIVASKSANKKKIPIILDVCGAGATALRNEKSFEILNSAKISIIKGNASEIAKIGGEKVQTKGVDSTKVEKNLLQIAARLANERKCVVVITGKEDIISDGEKHYIVRNGDEMMSHVVGTGCMATSVIGTFAAVENNLAKASAAGICCYEIAAELAARNSDGPGTFKTKLFDFAFHLNKEQIENMARIEEL